MKLHCLIVDDEEIARKGVEQYLMQVPFAEVSGTCDNAIEALSIMSEKRVDVVFLDIQMPILNGLDFLKTLQRRPLVVITTAYPNYALEGFDLDVIDYLVKPFSFERFLKASNKCKSYYDLVHGKAELTDDHIFIKSDNRIEKIFISEILFIEALENYVYIYTLKQKYLTLVGLGVIGNHLAGHGFVKVHKSFYVSRPRIESIEGNTIVIGEHRIPISRERRDEIIEELTARRFIKR